MKKIISLFLAAVFALSFASCEDMLPGVGDGTGERTAEHMSDPIESDILISETSSLTGWMACIDWMDFVRIGGVIYDGGFKNETVDKSRIGEQIGKIEHNVKSSYESQAEYEADSRRDMSAYIRDIGCKVYKVIDDENAVAVLDGGEFYFYTCKKAATVSPFTIRGYDLLGAYSGEGNRGVSINSLAALKREFDDNDILSDKKFAEFTDEYFNQNTLVIATFETGWGGTDIGISGIAEYGGALHVSAVSLNTTGEGDDAIHTWMFFITIPKTDDTNVTVSLEPADPLKDGVREIKYEDISKYMSTVNYERLRVYEGQAITTEAALREHIYTKYGNGCQIGDINISYEPVQMYWFAEFRAQSGCDIMIYELVVRAADGKIVSGNR